MKRLKTGAAYHGNRMLSHAIADMNEMVRADMDIVVHMLSHTDWERHDRVMGDIFKASEDAGLEVWVDNWGIGGAPGDKSHFLSYHPEAHMYYGNGNMHGYQICLNSPAYRQFVKDWATRVKELGAKTVFWDEPNIPAVKLPDGSGYYSACTCPTCRKIFEERYNKPMPEVMDADVADFRNSTLIEYHEFIAEYSASIGLESVICLMPFQIAGMKDTDDEQKKLLAIDTKRIFTMQGIENIGTDPYWYGNAEVAAAGTPYGYVYEASKLCVETAASYGKESHIWIQGYNSPRHREEEIIDATEAAYDAGARTILSWGFHACESNNYRSQNPMKSWLCTVEGLKRIKAMDRDRILEKNRKKFKV